LAIHFPNLRQVKGSSLVPGQGGQLEPCLLEHSEVATSVRLLGYQKSRTVEL